MRRSSWLAGWQILALGGLLISWVSGAAAQQKNDAPFPKFDLYGGYLIAGEFPYNEFNFGDGVHLQSDFGSKDGLEASFTRNFSSHLGIKGDFSAQFHHDGFSVNACNGTVCSSQPGDVSAKLFNFLGGPEIKWRFHRFSPFTHALFGLAHTTATFSTSGALNLSLNTSETGFAMAFGGGVDIRLARHFSWRTAMDYNPKWVGRDDNGSRVVLQDLRFTSGLAFHFH